jgi:hypothetical protein
MNACLPCHWTQSFLTQLATCNVSCIGASLLLILFSRQSKNRGKIKLLIWRTNRRTRTRHAQQLGNESE